MRLRPFRSARDHAVLLLQAGKARAQHHLLNILTACELRSINPSAIFAVGCEVVQLKVLGVVCYTQGYTWALSPYYIQWPFGRADYAHSHYASIMADVQITH